MKKKTMLLSFVLFFLFFVPVSAEYDYNSPEFQSIVSKLYMQGHSDHDIATCSVKQMYYEEVLSMLNEEGMSEDEIIQYYVDEYGQSALKEPEFGKSGILAWLIPFAVIVAGLIMIVFWLKKVKKGKQAEEANGVSWQSDTEKEITEKIFDEERYKRF